MTPVTPYFFIVWKSDTDKFGFHDEISTKSIRGAVASPAVVDSYVAACPGIVTATIPIEAATRSPISNFENFMLQSPFINK